MKVFKFGGASVKNADGVRNLVRVLEHTGYKDIFIIVSAMGKTTNALEQVLTFYFNNSNYLNKIDEIESMHLQICTELLPYDNELKEIIKAYFDELKDFLLKNKSTNYDFVYDQTICVGELVSTRIVQAYLASQKINCHWIDVREFIKTDSTFREAIVDWELTCENLNQLEKNHVYVTQGFIGSDENFITTTLGREGSDYSGAIVSYCLEAESLTIWKDVPGVLNADPRYFVQTTKLNQISYEEAIELAYYGASIIHPKTLQPLQRKQIPLLVKSFIEFQNPGTRISSGPFLEPEIACYIVKKNQHVLHISTINFSFIDEAVIRDVFRKLAENQLKVNLIQISAISLSLCIEDKFNKLDLVIHDLEENFKIETSSHCDLYTIRHPNTDSDKNIPGQGKTLIRQSGINTLQIVKSNL
ncbi:MAG: aspartate kinase [Flavobacteriaceae bacterium]|nr:aspartate kinase [Flavobacteriaceae bacterium]